MKCLTKFVVVLCASLFSVANAADTADYMRVVELGMKDKGFEHNGFSVHQSLKRGERKTYTIHTTKGKQYALVGLCDNDCSDLDLTLLDEDGDVVGRDYEGDDLPMLQFTAHRNSYKVRVEMEKCSTSTCYVRVKGFRKK